MFDRLRSIAFGTLLACFGALAASQAAVAANPQVELDTTAGKIVLELFPDAAPKTVENFLTYVKSGQYDGTQFHRVISGFMIQAGGFTTDFKEKPTRAPIQNEAEQSSKAGHLNTPGTIAMARTRDPHSATAQFFINVADNKSLNFRSADVAGYGYVVFGKVVSGMDVVNKIAASPKGAGKPVPPGTPLDPRDVPNEPIVINKAVILGNAK
jgi:peptidyl-prolyl cis-trans isomerase A (cyclophilin A)/peptidyl-prolyl cis-trans isomerase B (cyclophilin B)